MVDWVGAGGSCLRVIRICIAILQSGGAWVVRFVAALLVVLFVLFNGDGESVYSCNNLVAEFSLLQSSA